MDWDRGKLSSVPCKGGLILAGDDRIERFCEDTMMRGSPDAVLVARDEQECREALIYCNAEEIPVTFCGAQTSMTGASVAMDGLIISTEKLGGVIDIGMEDGQPVVVVRSGTIVADLQKAVADAGYFYPVAPTSRDECSIGGNINTNATGEDSYKYGPVRHYVKRLEIMLSEGSTRQLAREPGERPSRERNRAGYFMGWRNPIDLIVGSEGTLAFVSQIALSLLPPCGPFFAALIPLPSNDAALKFVMQLATGKAGLSARTLELVDSGALKLMRTAAGFPNLPDAAGALLYVKQEFGDEAERDELLGRWYEAALPFATAGLADNILIAQTREEQEGFRLWRHRIPEAANEIGHGFWPNGGGKVGSDWWVPIERIAEMMAFFYREALATGLQHMGYAHIGAGHPHTNILAPGPEDKQRALEVLRKCCRKAVELGGGVAGEHGIGKLHTDLLSIQHGAAIIDQMKSWKREYDPNWILGRGTIFPEA
ncbi:MAG: FAD-binding oxidoreductase [bacterium]